jgi:hypothetical protein
MFALQNTPDCSLLDRLGSSELGREQKSDIDWLWMLSVWRWNVNVQGFSSASPTSLSSSDFYHPTYLSAFYMCQGHNVNKLRSDRSGEKIFFVFAFSVCFSPTHYGIYFSESFRSMIVQMSWNRDLCPNKGFRSQRFA